MADFQATFGTRSTGANLLRLGGAINEQTDLHGLLDEVPAGRLIVHLGAVTDLDDAGIRAWVAWLAILDARNVRVDLVACSPQMVEAFNADAQLARSGKVRSVQAAYYCAKCDREDLLVVTIEEVQKAGGAPHRACEECIGRLVMVEDPDRYFEFVAHIPRRRSYDEMSPLFARGSNVGQTARMLSLRPSTFSLMQAVLAKHQPPSIPHADNGKYIVAVASFALGIVAALYAML